MDTWVIVTAAAGRPGHGPVNLLLESFDELGFAWDSAEVGWLRPGLPPPQYACWTVSALKAAFLDACRAKAASRLCTGKGFGVGPC